jgi:hypothetical protein
MKLYEFFNVPFDRKEKDTSTFLKKSDEDKDKMSDDVFWFIVDHDNLHKEYVLPFVRDMKSQINSPDFNRGKFTKKWLPMVKKGCQLFYKHKKLKDDPKDLFSNELQDDLCKRLCDKFIEDVKEDSYNVGIHKR